MSERGAECATLPDGSDMLINRHSAVGGVAGDVENKRKFFSRDMSVVVSWQAANRGVFIGHDAWAKGMLLVDSVALHASRLQLFTLSEPDKAVTIDFSKNYNGI